MQPDIEGAYALLAEWLEDGGFLPGESPAASGAGNEKAAMIDLFIEIAKKRGFSVGIVALNGHYMGRWSHPRIAMSRLDAARPTATRTDARLLACATLLRDPFCAACLMEA
jgi:hypothetical protein